MAAGLRPGGRAGRCVEPGHPLAAPRGHPGGNGTGTGTGGQGDRGDSDSAGGKGTTRESGWEERERETKGAERKERRRKKEKGRKGKKEGKEERKEKKKEKVKEGRKEERVGEGEKGIILIFLKALERVTHWVLSPQAGQSASAPVRDERLSGVFIRGGLVKTRGSAAPGPVPRRG